MSVHIDDNTDDGESDQRPPSSDGQRKTWHIMPIVVALLVALTAFLNSFPPARTSLIGWVTPHQTETVTPGPTVGIPGRVPNYCRPGAKLAALPGSNIPVVRVRGLNIWLVGFSGPRATIHYTNYAPRTARGWSYTLILNAAADVTNPITLNAVAVDSIVGATTVWLSTSDAEHATDTLTFDPSMTSPASDGTREWPLTIIIPSAGCYFLNVQYGNQETGIYFAAGL